MKKVPISIIIDDSAPLIHVFREHSENKTLKSGEELLSVIPNVFLEEFCDITEEYGISGKFSVVPMPGCKGDIVNGIEGHTADELKQWLDTVNTRLAPYFDFCPEILTHHKALNLETGKFTEESENQWSTHQNRTSLANYIAKALELMCDAGIKPTGVTSPWTFGDKVENDYVAAICDAFYRVMNKKKSWYFLHNNTVDSNIRPSVKYRENDRCVVEIVRTVSDSFWQTIHCSRTDADYIKSVADELISADGTSGQIIDALNRNSYPILVTHWQALFSNGRKTGLSALKLVSARIEKHLSHRVQWKSFSFLMDEAIEKAGL